MTSLLLDLNDVELSSPSTKKAGAALGVALATGGVLLATTTSAEAQVDASDAIAQMDADFGVIATVANAAIPVAIGIGMFAIGYMLIKRVGYA